MTFVFPILLGGLALAGVPILLHLILRQKPKTLPFPAFRFLVQRHRSNLRKLQLRHVLLLALRVLLIVAICLALARPKLFHQGLSLSSERPVAAVFVFDTSPSMDYRSSDQVSRLKEAQDRGLQLLDELPEGSRILVLDSAEPLLSDKAEWLTSLSQARQRINQLKVRAVNAPVTGSIEQALRQFAILARGTEDDRTSALPRLLCVFSDQTAATWPAERRAALVEQMDQLPAMLEGLQQLRTSTGPLTETLKSLREELPPPAGVDYAEQSLAETLGALAERSATLERKDLHDEALQQQVRQARTQARQLRAAVIKSADKPFDADSYGSRLIKQLDDVQRQLSGVQALAFDVGMPQAVDVAILGAEFPRDAGGQMLQLFSGDEKVILQVSVQALGKDLSTAVECRVGTQVLRREVDLPAGQRVNVPFELDLAALKLGTGPHTFEVRLTSKDSWEGNNQRFVALQVQAPRRVLVLADTKAKADRFARALTLLRYAGEVHTPAELPKLDLGKYEAVYLFGLAEPDAGLWKAVDAYVQQGGSVGIVPGGDEMKPAAYQGPVAKNLLPATWKEPAAKTAKKGEPEPIGAMWDLKPAGIFQHPLLRPLRAWMDDPRLDFIVHARGARRYWLVDPAPKGAATIVSYSEPGNPPALLERLNLPGKVVQFTTPLDDREPRWNNYAEDLTSLYLALTKLVTSYLTGEAKGVQLNFDAGPEPPRLALPLSPRYPTYQLRGQDLFETIAAEPGQNELKLREAALPGNYALEGVPSAGQDGVVIGRFSVNLAAAEADLSRVPSADVEGVLAPDAVIPADRSADIRELLAGHWSEPLELFPYLMVLLLFVLAVENLLANKFYRREDT
jgi:hypothetical protein